MNILMNSLPTRTWNHLKMNDSLVSVDGSFTNHIPEVSWDPAEVFWSREAPWTNNRSGHGFSADLTAQTTNVKAGLLETAEGIEMTHPAILRYAYEESEHAVSKLVLHAAKDSTLSALLMFTAPRSGSRDRSILQTEIYAEENAKVQLFVAQLLGEESVCLQEISGICDDNARVYLTRLELGAKKSYTGANLDLRGRQSDFTTEIGYHAKEGQLLDMNYVALHHGQKTTSLMEANGTLEEHAQKIFRGTIDFQQGCAGAKGTENENVLLLGEDVSNQTIPLILCKEEDVEGNHGASIGRLDEKVLFYLGSRGISEEDAQQIIARSRIEAICNKFPDEAIRAEIHTFVGGKEQEDDAELQS